MAALGALVLAILTTPAPRFFLNGQESGQFEAASIRPPEPLTPLPTTSGDGGARNLIQGSATLNLKPATPDSSEPAGAPKVKTSLNEHDVLHMEFAAITLPQLVEVLTRFADRPIIDRTGLTGAYSVALDISQQDLRRRAGGLQQGSGPEPAGLASDPGAESLFSAVQRLGLKLQQEKLPMDTVVIEYVRKTPAENQA